MPFGSENRWKGSNASHVNGNEILHPYLRYKTVIQREGSVFVLLTGSMPKIYSRFKNKLQFVMIRKKNMIEFGDQQLKISHIRAFRRIQADNVLIDWNSCFVHFIN